ncbi:chloride channel protein [Crocosphaera sp. XPORK-15E]|uniref:chloride channel protein n=1 Tax=Crocosphaera sp. XPORK-15E TaxID=3110247 RepID=UPI002B21A69D|nr:chloride channel protein [Crocosphaera sp. XPORK-15E]MEA5533451.1 chloride channel protein [Crocosphaera sp. XPORK-15E]
MQPHLIPQRLYQWVKSRHFGMSATDPRYALVEACIIGFLSAVAALILKEGIGWLGGWRVALANQFGAIWVLPLVGLSFGYLAGWLIEQTSPTAAGGGITQVKGALARYSVPLSLRVAVVKMIGTILVLGAGLTLGRRAPTVHIGAALAAQLSSWVPTSPEHRRQMIAAGAAAGLAAGFSTPIAGVLFVIEELMRDVSGLTLETAIVASFTGAVVSLVLQSTNLKFPSSLLDLPDISFAVSDIPFYLLLGILAGVLGAFFNRGLLFSLQIQRRLKLPLSWRIGLVGMISGVIVSFLPPFFLDNAGLQGFLVMGELNGRTILLAFIAHFFLTMLAYSSNAPGGLFAPALVLGAALGYLVGDFEHLVTGNGVQSAYALAGMGAFFTAVVRVPVTAIVIVFELNTDFNIVLPLMLSCAVSYIVAESMSRGSLYERMLGDQGIFINATPTAQDFLSTLTAARVMQSNVETLPSNLTLDEVLQAMSTSSHRGFPVMENGKLVGIVTQSDLANLAQHSGQTALREFMTPRPITVQAEAFLSDVLYLLNRYQLSRLPVTEGSKLVGIITRTDIIRIEANQLEGNDGDLNEAMPEPSYIAYQTRAPLAGDGRILLPLVNPDTATSLFRIGAAIATQQNQEIECLQVIKVPKHSDPAQTSVITQHSRQLLQRAERLGRHHQIPVHTQIRVAHDIAQTILDTIRERHINLMILEWKGNTRTPGAVFGHVVDILIRKASCELVLVKLGKRKDAYPQELDKDATWLIPIAGGPNSKRALELLPGLTHLYTRSRSPIIWLCQVFSPAKSAPNYQHLEAIAKGLKEQIDRPVIPLPIRSQSVADAVVHLASAESCDVVMLGVSREGLLEQVIHGNIPKMIAQKVESTVILVRGSLEQSP